MKKVEIIYATLLYTCLHVPLCKEHHCSSEKVAPHFAYEIVQPCTTHIDIKSHARKLHRGKEITARSHKKHLVNYLSTILFVPELIEQYFSDTGSPFSTTTFSSPSLFPVAALLLRHIHLQTIIRAVPLSAGCWKFLTLIDWDCLSGRSHMYLGG